MLSIRMKEKDSIKCKEWERRRREKINDAFKNLSQLLPNHDPAKNIAKIDILEKSTEFVKELRLSNSRLLSQQAESDEKCKLIKELQDEVNKLILRVKQLTTLLKQAKIAIPIGPHIKTLGKKKLKWSEKIGPENLENSTGDKSCITITAGFETVNPTSLKTTPSGQSNESNNSSSINQNLSGTGTNNVQQCPLKEPNLEVHTSDSIPASGASSVSHTVNTSSSNPPSNNSPIKSHASNPPGTPVHLAKDGLPSISNKPTAGAPSAPITLPMQTIILTSCQVPPIVNQNPQMITRIALGPTRILPRPADGVLRKIAILPIRKPLPPKEKKRRNRKKKVPVVTAEAQVQTSKSSSNVVEASGISENATSDAKVAEDKETPAPATSTSESPKNSITKLQNSVDANNTIEISGSGTATEIAQVNETLKAKEASVNPDNIEMEGIPEQKVDREVASMEVDLPEVGEEVEISSGASRILTGGQPNETENSESPEEVLMEGDMVTRVPEGDQNSMKSPDSISASKTLLDISSSTTLTQGQVDLSNSNHSENKTNEDVGAIIRKDKVGEESSSGNSKSYELRVIEASDVERSIQPSELDRLIAPNPNTNSPMGDAVTGDKISECIARSIDLIDAPDGELMELADNWGDSTVNSPKSPISPTQMFLNMFPLLPRESIVSVSEGAQQGSGTGKSNFQYRSSFYIDAMLPDDPPPAPPPSNTVAVRDTSEICGSGPKNSRQSTEISVNPSMPVVSSITSSADPVRSILTMTASSASLPTASSVSHRAVNVATMAPQCFQKSSTLPVIPTSSVKSSTQKQTTLETPKLSSKSKLSQPEAKESNKNSHPPVLPTSSSTSFPSDFNLFPEPLDFGNFHHLSLSQMSLTEDLFREVSRIRNPPDCQQSSTNSINNTANLTSNFQQFDFGNQFHYSHQTHQQTQPQKQTSTQSSTETQNQYSIPDIMTNSSATADSASRSHHKQSNSNAQVESQHSQGTNQFYQPMNFTPSSMPDYSHQSHNTNLQTPRYDFNSEPTYNARQSNYHPFSQEPPHPVPQLPQQSNQKQNSTSSNNSNKHQLFRPQDFNQSSVTGHHQTQNIHRSNISHVQQSQPATANKSNAISHKQASSVSGVSSQNLPPPAQISSTMPQRQESSRKPNVSSSQSLSSNQPNSQPVIHQSYVTPPHPVQSQIGVQSKEQISKQQPYHVTGNSGNASSEKQSRTNPNTAQVTSKDQQQSKGYSKSQSSKNSESSSSRKSSSTSCTRRTNQGSSSATNQPTTPQHIPQNVPRLPEPNQFPLMNNTPLPIPSFPDFSLATNFHQQYETFPAAPHYHHQHHPPNNTSTSSQPNPVNHHQQQQRKSSSASARHTPFYLQDVNPPCESYNYPNTNTNPPQPINLNPVHGSTHHHHGTHGTTYNSNASSSQSKPPNYPPNNQSAASVPHHSHNHSNYFPNPASHNSPMYPSGYTHQNSPTSSARTHQHEPLSANYNLNANSASRSIQQSSNSSSQQPGKISKSSSSASSQMQPNQTNYPSNSGENSSNSSMPSSRPVNWMTTDTSSRTNSNKPAVASSQTRSSQQTSAPANPFSVSKLVGNASGQTTSNNNTTNTSSTKPNNPSMVSSTSARCSNNNQSTNNTNNPTSNSSYCAESLIRKNPSTNTTSNPSWNNLNFSQIQQPNQHHSVPHQHNISNAAPYEIPQNDQFNFSGYHTTNFPQHGAHQYNLSHNNTASESGGSNNNNNNNAASNASSNNIPATGHIGGNPYGPPFAAHDQQQQHSQQPHHVHQSQYHHHFPSHNSNSSNHHLHQHHGTTSSVSNFNLSSIFPEINDKRGSGGGGGNSSSSNATGSNTGNASSQNSSNNNSCNYYATVHSRK